MSGLEDREYTKLEWFKYGFYTSSSFLYTRFCLVLYLLGAVPFSFVTLSLICMEFENQRYLGVLILFLVEMCYMNFMLNMILSVLKQFSDVTSRTVEVTDVSDVGVVCNDGTTLSFSKDVCPKQSILDIYGIVDSKVKNYEYIPKCRSVKKQYINDAFKDVSSSTKLALELFETKNNKLFALRMYIVNQDDFILLKV